MKLVRRYERCLILSLPAIGKRKLELVFAPAGYTIAPHTHNNVDIELMLLFGHNITFHRHKKGEFLGESFLATFKNIGRIFTISAGDIHWFGTSKWPLLFLNIEHWHTTPTSAAIDLQNVQ